MQITTGLVRAAALGLALAFIAVTAGAQQPPPQVRIRGDIVSLTGPDLKVKTREGQEVTIKLADNVGVSTVRKVALEDIKPGTFVGIAATPQRDGRLMAQEVLLFPEAMRGTGEGHRPWDLTPDSTMTNATVEASVMEAKNGVLQLKYKDGEKNIVVSPETPLVTIAPGDKSLLKPGAYVFVAATKGPDGTLNAARITAEKDGVKPPM